MRSRHFFNLAVTFALLGLQAGTGCVDKSPPPTPRSDLLPIESYPKVVALDGLGRTLLAAKPVVVGGAGTPIKVSVPIRSKVDEDLEIEFRFEFLDAAGQAMETDQVWRRTQLMPKVQVFLEDAALSSKSSDWRLQIRRGARAG